MYGWMDGWMGRYTHISTQNIVCVCVSACPCVCVCLCENPYTHTITHHLQSSDVRVRAADADGSPLGTEGRLSARSGGRRRSVSMRDALRSSFASGGGGGRSSFAAASGGGGGRESQSPMRAVGFSPSPQGFEGVAKRLRRASTEVMRGR